MAALSAPSLRMPTLIAFPLVFIPNAAFLFAMPCTYSNVTSFLFIFITVNATSTHLFSFQIVHYKRRCYLLSIASSFLMILRYFVPPRMNFAGVGDFHFLLIHVFFQSFLYSSLYSTSTYSSVAETN